MASLKPRSLRLWLLLCLCLAQTQQVNTKRLHAKRFYDSHDYYVLELAAKGKDSAQLHLQAEEVAASLSAQLVEQVGELQGHFLINAPRLAGGQDSREDPVVRQYQRMKRKRSFGNIISLEKQETRQRVKRVFTLDTDHQETLRKRRQTQEKRQKGDVSSYLRDIVKRFSIFDPLFPKQWHIANDRMHENSINVTGVWAQGITGQGIKVAIVDDGLDMYSDDLAPNFFAEGSWDYNDHLPLPEPRLSDDQHGTRCAGEIAAAKNDACGVGVAYESKIAGIRILSGSISDADEASALNYGYQENDIYSCSWGPPDDGKSCEAPSRLIVKAILNGVTNGRAGKGSIFVFASGNGGAAEDQCNFDGYTNSIYSITVGAIDREGLHPFYSEACSAIMVVTYSSGSGDNIHTTDVGKRVCTSRHGGTSAAAPIAAGIFALVLQVRPDLTWRDMQHLCVRNAVVVNANDPDWSTTHVGRPFNHKYGYGKLDTWRLVEAARNWEIVKPQAWWESETVNVGVVRKVGDAIERRPLPLTAEGVTSAITISGETLRDANLDALEHVTVRLHVEHNRRGNIEVTLTSPNGVVSSLARSRRLDDAQVGLDGWQFMSVKHWDENPVGTWTIKVLDRQDNGKNGSFVSWSMSLWGSARDSSLANAYKLPHDEQLHLPPSPLVTSEEPEQTEDPVEWPVEEETTKSSSHLWTTATTKTKTYVKPTEHLPDDHDVAPGHSTLALDPTRPTSLPLIEEPDTKEDETVLKTAADAVKSASSFFGAMTSMISDRTMILAGVGSAVILAGGLLAFFLVRRKRIQRKSYAFERVSSNTHDLPMSAVSPTTSSFRTRETSGARTRDLYDAFGVSSEDSDSDGGADFKDDSAMDEFLADEERPSSRQSARNLGSNLDAARSTDVLFDRD